MVGALLSFNFIIDNIDQRCDPAEPGLLMHFLDFFGCGAGEEAVGPQDLASSCPTLLASVRDSQWPSPFSTARWRWTAVAWNEIQTYDWY